jgi:trafficking protein particle complex subunit 6
MDYLLIEAVNVLRASSAVATARAKKIEQEMAEAGILPPPPPLAAKPQPQPSHSQSQSQAQAQSHRDSIGSTISRRDAPSGATDDDEDEGLRTRLEAIGLHVGGNFVER